MIYYGKRNNSSKYVLNKLYIFLIYSVFVRPSIFFPWQFSVSLCVSPPINIITLTLSCYLPRLSTHQYSFPDSFLLSSTFVHPSIFSLTVSCYLLRLSTYHFSFTDSFLLFCTFVHPSIFSLTVSCYLPRLSTYHFSFTDSFLLFCTFVHPSIVFP